MTKKVIAVGQYANGDLIEMEVDVDDLRSRFMGWTR